jgi:hypothetical protein
VIVGAGGEGTGSHVARPRARRVMPVLLSLTIAGLSMAACGGTTRSANAVCHVFDTQGVALHNKYQSDANEASTDPLPAIVDAVLVPQQFATLMDNMAAVAPAPIDGDLVSLNSYFKQLAANEPGAIADPLKTLAANTVRSIQVYGSFNRVNQYILANCALPATSTTS